MNTLDQYLSSISTINAYRDSLFSATFIEENPALFLQTAWINVSGLRDFILARTREGSSAGQVTCIPGPAGQVPVSTGQQQVTGQDVGGKIPAGQVTEFNDEAFTSAVALPGASRLPPCTRIISEEDHETILILDSDEEFDMVATEFHQCSSSSSAAFNVKEEITDEALISSLASIGSTSLPPPRAHAISTEHHEPIIILDSDSEFEMKHTQIKLPSSSQDGSFDWDSDYSRPDVSESKNKSGLM
ncbi:hypothetical protein F5880DRAFT_1614518 [Lentinula raphanica]|nr:hypothetical protein F5880DRAFT_1614518 [Lentinula raphanica]